MMSLYWIPSALCVGAASYLAYHDKQGWGWFLLVAVLLAPVLKGINIQ